MNRHNKQVSQQDMRFDANHVVLGGFRPLSKKEVKKLFGSQVALMQVEGTDGASYMVLNFHISFSLNFVIQFAK